MIPNEDSYCEIDPEVVDKWGIPVLRFHWKWSDYEIKQAKHMQETFAPDHRGAWAARCWARMPGPDENYDICARAARSSTRWAPRAWATAPRTSVLDECCQAHEVKNLFVADGGPFVTNADKNVTWTILALSMRTSEHIADERRRATSSDCRSSTTLQGLRRLHRGLGRRRGHGGQGAHRGRAPTA